MLRTILLINWSLPVGPQNFPTRFAQPAVQVEPGTFFSGGLTVIPERVSIIVNPWRKPVAKREVDVLLPSPFTISLSRRIHFPFCLKFQVFFYAGCRPENTRESCRTLFLLRVVCQVRLPMRVDA